jgi:diguanylate cyclase (GGDEF)-like protein
LPNPHFLSALKRVLSSLPGRYLLGAVLLLAILLMAAWLAGAYLEGVREARTGNLRERREAVSQAQVIRSALWSAEHNLQAFSLTPSEAYRNRAIRAIRNGRSAANALAGLPWSQRNDQATAASRIAADFDRLRQSAGELIATRRDPDRLYPALGLMRETLGPANRNFLDAAQQALSSLEDRDRPDDDRVRTLLREVRYYWSRMVGEFRLFITARIGLLGGTQDQTRRANLETYHAGVRSALDKLTEIQREGHLGLSVDSAVDRMRQVETEWLQGFRRVEQLYTSRNWRADFPLITDRLYPVFEAIQAELQDLNRALERSARGEMAALSRAARNIAVFPWALVGLHLVVVGAGYLYLRRRVLDPLSQLTRALRREAEGKAAALSTAGGPSEIRELSEAFRRMRQEVRSRQGALEHQAFHDPLTGLPNRALLEDRLNQAILRSRRSGHGGALMMLDLDFFKEINDTFGHPTGDSVLQEVAERLSGELRESDTVARFGGDEFSILLPGLGADQAREAAARLLDALQPRLEVGGHNFHVSGSIGIVIFPEHGEEPETLVRRADMAMYQAKDKRQGAALFQTNQDNRSSAQLTGTAELYEDILQDRIPLHFQPQWELASDRMIGGETLLRWSSRDGTPVPPPEVLAMAQRAGVLHLLTRRILNAAMREAAGWDQASPRHLAVNLTTEDLQMGELPGHIREQLTAWGLAPAMLELEITENDMMADPERARRVLGELRLLGVRIAIDDYGTGYSSLAYLRGLPVDVLKIDKSFVMDLAASPDNQSIVRSTVELGHNLGLTVVAEGVEDADSLELLRHYGCDRAQGFHLGHPMPAEGFRGRLTAHGTAS